MLCRLYSIVQGQNTGARPNERPHRAGGLLHLPCFHSNENDIHFTDFGNITCRLRRRHDEVAEYAVHSQATGPNSLQVSASRHEHDIVTSLSKPASEVTA